MVFSSREPIDQNVKDHIVNPLHVVDENMTLPCPAAVVPDPAHAAAARAFDTAYFGDRDELDAALEAACPHIRLDELDQLLARIRSCESLAVAADHLVQRRMELQRQTGG